MLSAQIFLFLRLALATVLYLFLGAALYLLWLDLRQQAARSVRHQPVPIILRYELGGEIYPQCFTNPEVLIGRDPSCDCSLENSTVSARHARLNFRQGQWWLEDLSSTNGTFLNQERVSTPVVLTNGDQLRCGQVNLGVNLES